MYCEVDAVVVGYGATGCAVAEALKEIDVSFLISCGGTSRSFDLHWKNDSFRTRYFDGKFGNLNIWGSCLRKIPFEAVSHELPGLTRKEYDSACSKMSDLLGVNPTLWSVNGAELYYHYKTNLVGNLVRTVDVAKEDIGKTTSIRGVGDRYLVKTDKGWTISCIDVYLCTPIPEVIRLLEPNGFDRSEPSYANEHFLYLGATYESDHSISPSRFQQRLSGVSIRSHLETERTSALLIPRMSKPKTKSIVKIRREMINSVLARKWLNLSKLALLHPLESCSLLLWYLNLHPKTRFFDSIVMVNREIRLTNNGDSLIVEVCNLNLTEAERQDLAKIARDNKLKVNIQCEPLYENSQHMHGLSKKDAAGNFLRWPTNRRIHLMSSAGFYSKNVANITYSMMAIAYLKAKKYAE